MASSPSTPVRSGCPIANVLDLVGDRWSLLVLRDALFFGRHEFKEFLHAGEGIASNILAARLKHLVETDLLGVRPHPTNKVKRLYFATERAKALLPMLVEMVLWAHEHSPAAEVPTAVLRQMKKDRSAFVQQTLSTLDEWEKTQRQAG
jgi:DNA-binding HxlR family transcriptional regulator